MAPHSSTLAWKIPWWRSLVGCSPWGCKESDTTERLHFHFSLSCTGEGNGNPLQCSCLENPRDWGAWWAAAYGVAQNQTRLKRLSSSSSSIGMGIKNYFKWFFTPPPNPLAFLWRSSRNPSSNVSKWINKRQTPSQFPFFFSTISQFLPGLDQHVHFHSQISKSKALLRMERHIYEAEVGSCLKQQPAKMC